MENWNGEAWNDPPPEYDPVPEFVTSQHMRAPLIPAEEPNPADLEAFWNAGQPVSQLTKGVNSKWTPQHTEDECSGTEASLTGTDRDTADIADLQRSSRGRFRHNPYASGIVDPR